LEGKVAAPVTSIIYVYAIVTVMFSSVLIRVQILELFGSHTILYVYKYVALPKT
jgi:hypothetical protein